MSLYVKNSENFTLTKSGLSKKFPQMSSANAFMVAVSDKTKIATNLKGDYVLLQLDKKRFNFTYSRFNIVYSINNSYPRHTFVKPWFNSCDIKQDNERFLYIGIEIRNSKSYTLDSFVDLFLNDNNIIRFPVSRVKLLPSTLMDKMPSFAAHHTAEPNIGRIIRSSLVETGTESHLTESDDNYIDVRFEILPGLCRVALGCKLRNILGIGCGFQLRVTDLLLNTNAYLNYQIQMIELANLEMISMTGSKECSLSASLNNPTVTTFQHLIGHDSKFFLGPIFMAWFMSQDIRREPQHTAEKKLPINILIRQLISNTESSISGLFIKEEGRFSLTMEDTGTGVGLQIFRQDEQQLLAAYDGILISWVMISETLNDISTSCAKIAAFLGWHI